MPNVEMVISSQTRAAFDEVGRASPNRRARGALGLARRTATFAASTSMAGTLLFGGLAGGLALPSVAGAQSVVSACGGVQLPASVLRDQIVAPVVNGIAAPVEGTVNDLIETVDSIAALQLPGPAANPLVPAPTPLAIDVTGILDDVNGGLPLTIQALATDGTLVGPGDPCFSSADGFQLDAPQGLSIGGNAVTGLGATGNEATAAEIDAIAFGDNASTGIGSGGAMALGTNAVVDDGAAGAIAIGLGSAVAADAGGSVALGAGASASAGNSVALGAASATLRGAQSGYLAFGLDAPATSAGEVNVGNRTLTGLAAGQLAGDAVNVEQLAAVADDIGDFGTGLSATAAALGGTAAYDPATGTFTPPAYRLDGGAVVAGDVGTALTNLDGRTTVNTTDITNLTTRIGAGTVGLVQQLAVGADLTVGAGTDGDAVAFNRLGGATRVLTGLTNGALAAGSTDAVTGGQLADTNAAIGTLQTGLSGAATAFGAGAAYDPVTGLFTAPGFALEGGTVVERTVGGAVTNLDGRVTTLAGLITGGGVGLLQQAGPGADLTVGAATDGDAVLFNQTGGGTRLLTGLTAGAAVAGSSDAVTGDQLAATNAGLASTAAALGGGAGIDPVTGVLTAPAYSLDGGAVIATDVGDAIGNLDGRTTANTTAIVDLSTQISTGSVGLVRQAAPGADLTVGAATDGDAVAFNRAGGATRLVTGLSAGAVADGSSDAVTGGQAFATGQSIASALGGGAAVTPAGTISAPTYSIGGTGFTNVGSAFAALDDSVTALQNQVGAVNPDGQLAYISVNTASGPARATGAESIASGGGAFATGANTVAYGSNSEATAANASAYGSNASATGTNASAYGANASAGFDNSSAFGAGAAATRANQMAFGTTASTYSMAGITSDASRAAQSGPLDLVTTDAAGNLGSVPLSDFFSGMSGIEGRLDGFERKFDRQSDGIAIAMAMGAVALPADKSFALTGSVGYFNDTAAFGIGAVGQIAENWYVNGGVGVGTERGTVAGRAGLTFAW